MPDWDSNQNRESDEDAAWRDLVARFEEPARPVGPSPWPDRENVPGPYPPGASDTDGSDGASGTDETEEPRGDGAVRGDGDEGIRGFDDEGVRGPFDADGPTGTLADGPALGSGGPLGAHEPDVIQAARRERRGPAHGTRARRIRARRPVPPPAPDDDDHFVPPAPPPLPKLDPVTKGAWAALFGGPAYLVIATVAGWSVPGIAAFFAVAAFVAGFAILVLRMNDSSGPGGPQDGDDGAVV